MPTIHPTAIVAREVEMADDVEIGPGCVLQGPITLGPRTRLIGHVYLHGRVALGAGNVLYPNVCVGFEPQHRRYDPRQAAGVQIGDDNLLREGVTIHSATGQRPTTMGSRNYLMCNSHLGHDVVMGDDCTFGNGAVLGGHVQVQDRVILGGNAGAHQFVRLGRLSMLGGAVGVVQDLPPFCTVYDMRCVGSLNLVGLRRGGYQRHITPLRGAFDLLYRRGHVVARALELIEQEFGDDPLCAELAAFVRQSQGNRGITPYRPRGPRHSDSTGY